MGAGVKRRIARISTRASIFARAFRIMRAIASATAQPRGVVVHEC
jgi:hypothetical protein